jgi:exosortase
LSLAALGAALWGITRPGENRLAPLADQLLDRSAVWLGGFILGWGVLFSLWGIFPGQNDFFKDVGMVVALFGVVLLLSGWAVMRVAWFPIVFLFCGLPWPDQVYSWVAGPLQHLAAAVAVRFLTVCNIPSSVAGTKIMMFVNAGEPPRILNVEEACAGLKSLMTFVTLAAGWAFVFMSSRPLWHRLVQTASAVPIAIFCNVMRVSFTGLIDKRWGPEYSEGFAHRFVGLMLLVPAFFLILFVGWVLDNLFIEEADDEEAVAGSGKPDQRGRVAAKLGNKVVVPNRPAVAVAGGAVRAAQGLSALSSSNLPAVSSSNPSKGPQKMTSPPSTSSARASSTASAQASSRQAPARKPASAGFRPPPASAVRPPGPAGQAGAPSPGSTASTSSPPASSGQIRPRSAGAQPDPANPSAVAAAKTTQPAKPPGARRAPEKPVGKPSQNKEAL